MVESIYDLLDIDTSKELQKLVEACWVGDYLKFQKYIDQVRSINTPINGNTPLIWATTLSMQVNLKNRELIITELLLLGADPNFQNQEGTTALIHLVQESGGEFNLELARILIMHGADPYLRDNQGYHFFDHQRLNFEKSMKRSVTTTRNI